MATLFFLRRAETCVILSLRNEVILVTDGIYSIEEIRAIVAPIAREHGVASVSLFGSYSKGQGTAHSDVDLKIEKGALRSLFQLSGFRLALEEALSRSVDLVTTESSDKDFLQKIEKDEVLLYRNP